jgi:hypothetical protein
LTGIIVPPKLLRSKFLMTTLPTDRGLLDAPITAIERGAKRNSRFRMDIQGLRRLIRHGTALHSWTGLPPRFLGSLDPDQRPSRLRPHEQLEEHVEVA